MGWLSRRSAGARSLEEAATERVERLARQWRPVPGGDLASTAAPGTDPPAPDPWQSVLEPVQGAPRIRVGPWNRPAVRALVVLVTVCLAVTVWWWWSGRPHEVMPAPIVLATGQRLSSADSVASPPADAAAPPREVVVHVTGQVARPGLVTLPAGSRVADALAAAGGVTRRRASDTVNLARILVDGEQIAVGGTAAVAVGGVAPTSTGPPILDLNTADSAALEGLPGVGPVLAGRIVAWRAANGPFRSVDELGEVSGIGDATLARLRPIVRV